MLGGCLGVFGGLGEEKGYLCCEGVNVEYFIENLVGMAFPYGFKNSQ